MGLMPLAEFYSLIMDTLDKTDLQILRTLQQNARLTTKELAARVNLSPTPVFERQKRLEAKGISANTSLCSTPTSSGVASWCSATSR